MARPSVEERFWAKVDKNGPIPGHRSDLGPCWQWTGWSSVGGYGRFWVQGRNVLVHRWAYQRFVGPIPVGWNIDHLCGNPGCVNFKHLEALATMKANVLRGRTTVSAVNARKTHCSKGHPYDEANTAVTARGYRRCRTCQRERSKTAAWREYHRNYDRQWKLRQSPASQEERRARERDRMRRRRAAG